MSIISLKKLDPLNHSVNIHINSSLSLHLMAASYSSKHLLLCVIVALVMIFMAGMVDAVDEEASALRGAIQKAMTAVGECKNGRICYSDSECSPGKCVSYALFY
jgi:hypothetical protein